MGHVDIGARFAGRRIYHDRTTGVYQDTLPEQDDDQDFLQFCLIHHTTYSMRRRVSHWANTSKTFAVLLAVGAIAGSVVIHRFMN